MAAEVVAEDLRPPVDVAVDRLGVRIEQQLARIEAVARCRVRRPVDPEAVALAGADAGHDSRATRMRGLRRAGRASRTPSSSNRQSSTPLGVLGEDGEVRSVPVPRGAEWDGSRPAITSTVRSCRRPAAATLVRIWTSMRPLCTSSSNFKPKTRRSSALQDRRASLPEAQRLGEVNERLAELTADLEIATKQHDEIAREQDKIEGEIGLADQKIAREEQRLFGGAVSNPKELGACRPRSQMLKRKRAELEDAPPRGDGAERRGSRNARPLAGGAS